MGVNANKCFVQDPVQLVAAEVSPRLISADVTLPAAPFSFEDAQTIFAALHIHEFLTTALAGTNNDLTIIARKPGNQNVRVRYVDPAANNAVASVIVASEDITVNLATNGAGTITTTAAQALALLQASAAASALAVFSLAAGNDGTGVLAALAFTALGGVSGTTPTLDVKLRDGIAGRAGNVLKDHSAFAQQTAIGSVLKTFSDVGPLGEWVFDVGGTTPIFAVSIDVTYRP
jgi:hypothetical protein